MTAGCPFTRTQPCSIHASASLREQRPNSAMRLFSRMVCAGLPVEAAAAGLAMRTAGAAGACEADGEGGRGFGAASVGKRAAGEIFGGFGGFGGIVLLLFQELFAPVIYGL